MTKYAIPIKEETLDLIEVLNDGVRPGLEEKSTYFLTETDETKNVPNDIQFEDDLYDENGHSRDTSIQWVVA